MLNDADRSRRGRDGPCIDMGCLSSERRAQWHPLVTDRQTKRANKDCDEHFEMGLHSDELHKHTTRVPPKSESAPAKQPIDPLSSSTITMPSWSSLYSSSIYLVSCTFVTSCSNVAVAVRLL